MTVYNFGSINIDYVYRVERFVQPGETLASESLDTVLGGKGANQSVALARAGAPVVHLGRVSQADQWVVDELASFGVDINGIESVDEASGHAIIQVDAQGENAIVLHGGANQHFDAKSLATLLKDAQPGDWLLLQNECNALADAFAIAQEKQLKIAFNPAPMNELAASLPLEHCQVLIVNEVEALQLANFGDVNGCSYSEANADCQTELQKRYPGCQIVLTLGGKGAMLLHNGKCEKVDAAPVDAVDSTGAGDTFVGYFLAGLVNELAPEQALERACVAGALAVTVAGATRGIPSRAAVEAFIKGK